MGQRAAKAANPYIISPRVDFLLIVGAVILCPALLLPAAAWTSRYTVRLVVMTFGAVGRHFPSFLRTYGDREIIQTYRTRLIVAPVLLFAVTLGFSLNGLHGMLLIAFCWIIWHGMMQHFGFMRIYDAKIRSMDKTTARLDWWISFSWFGLCLSLSPHQCGSPPAKEPYPSIPATGTPEPTWKHSGKCDRNPAFVHAFRHCPRRGDSLTSREFQP